MAQQGTDKPSSKLPDRTGDAGHKLDSLSHCADLNKSEHKANGPGDARKGGTCSLPSLAIENEKPGAKKDHGDHTLTDKAGPAKIGADRTTPAKTAVDRTPGERSAAEKIKVDKVGTDKAVAPKGGADKAHPGTVHADKTREDKAHVDKTQVDKAHPDKTHPDNRTHLDKVHADRTHAAMSPADNAAAAKIAADKALIAKAAAEKTASAKVVIDPATEKSNADNVAKELRSTALFGWKSWVEPQNVLGALRAAKVTNAARFENSFQTLEGTNLRQELRQQLTVPNDFRTAVSILENRENEKGIADKLETALSRDLLHLKLGANAEQTLEMLRQIKPDQRGRFETNFPKNEGDDHELRPELAKQLGSTDEFRTAIAILDNREAEKQSADAIVKALQQTSWWGLAASPDPLTILVTLSGMEPKDRAQFEKNFPLNEGEGLNLREQLAKYLGSNEQYDLIIKMLDEYKGQTPPIDAPVAENPQQSKQQLSSIGDWLDAFKKLNQTLGIKGVADIDPRNVNEPDFKAKYAAEAVKAGQKFHLSPEQTKHIAESLYALELGGWGTSYTTAGMPPRLIEDGREQERLGFHPISSAVGFNQLLKANTMAIVKEHGAEIADRLKQLQKELPAGSPQSLVLEAKAQLMTTLNKMVSPKSTPDARLTTKELGNAVQALNIDGDIGPLIQGQELRNLLSWFTTKKDSLGNKSTAEMLPGAAAHINARGAIFDKVPHAKKAEVAARAIAAAKPGEKDMQTAQGLAHKLAVLPPGLDGKLYLSPQEKQMLAVAQERSNWFLPNDPSRALLEKVSLIQNGKMTPEKLAPAAIELANLAGPKNAEGMLLRPHESTSKYFSPEGLAANRLARGKDGGTLLADIYTTMQTNRQQRYVGNVQFHQAFDNVISSKKRI